MTTTFLEMQSDVLATLGQGLENDKDTRTRVKRWLNQAAQDVWMAHPWQERRTKAWLNLVAPYDTGTVTVTEDSTTVTGSGTTFTSAMVGRKFALGYEHPWYEISAFVSVTEITLDRAYRETTAAAQSYTIYEDEYLLDDMDTLITNEVVLFTNSQDYPLSDLTNQGWNTGGHFPRSEGQPTAFRLIEESSGTPKIQVWPVPDDAYAVRYPFLKNYTQMVDDSDTPGMIDTRSDIVVCGGLARAYRMLGETQNALIEEQRFWNLISRAISNERKRYPQSVQLRPMDRPLMKYGRTGAYRINYSV